MWAGACQPPEVQSASSGQNCFDSPFSAQIFCLRVVVA